MAASKGRYGYKVSMNEHGDLNDYEYQSLLLTEILNPLVNTTTASQYSTSTRIRTTTKATTVYSGATTTIPPSIDWRALGAVTPAKLQGICGACWAFSSTAAIEAQNFKKTGKLVSLSEQNLIDCSRNQGNQGCGGGWMGYAFQYVIKNKGIARSESYPYYNNAANFTCSYNSSIIGATISGYYNLQSGNEYLLTKTLAQVGPVSVSIDASDFGFRFYSSGIYNSSTCSPYNLNHAVTLVGYGTENNMQYYIGKNSWGSGWGQNGFFQIARSWPSKPNMCGIASAAVYPV